MKYLLAGLLFFSFACKDQKSNAISDCQNNYSINSYLYSAIVEYQKNNPIPLKNKENGNLPPSHEVGFKYIYEVVFEFDKDSLIVISLKPDGIREVDNNSKYKISGIYRDSCLQQTYFIGDSGFVRKFTMRLNYQGLDSFYYDNSSIIDKMYARYVYKVQNGNLYLFKKIEGSPGK